MFGGFLYRLKQNSLYLTEHNIFQGPDKILPISPVASLDGNPSLDSLCGILPLRKTKQ